MDEDLIEIARQLYADENTAIDDDARVSLGEDGIWVAAWVFVSNSEIEARK